jgi:hypothetical protein
MFVLRHVVFDVHVTAIGGKQFSSSSFSYDAIQNIIGVFPKLRVTFQSYA